MKAAVMYPQGGSPEYTDFEVPIVQNEDELLVNVKAVAIKHVDKGRAAGTHYSSDAPKKDGRVIGGDGVFVLDNGTRVFGIGVSGTMAEKATIRKNIMVPIPDELDNLTAAALPNAVIGAAMGLKFKADIQPGDVVLVNGATGFTGRVAVQLAKHYGASKVIATGRNQGSLDELLSLGADETISLLQSDKDFKDKVKAIHSSTPIDVVIDYLWGHPAEMILSCFMGDGSFTNRIRYVSVGAMAGDVIPISAENLRSVNLQLSGSGLGAWSKQQVGVLFSQILPEAFRLAVEGKLKVKTAAVKLEDIGGLWNLDVADGQRLVVLV